MTEHMPDARQAETAQAGVPHGENPQERIDRAFARIDAATDRLRQSHVALGQRHHRLRASIADAVRGIDSLIAEDAG